MSVYTILRDLFGSGTWGTGGNLVASALLTVPAVIISHVRAHRQRERHHEDMKQHVTVTAGGIPVEEAQRTVTCPACGARVPAGEGGKLAVHSQHGVTCVASGWTIKEK